MQELLKSESQLFSKGNLEKVIQRVIFDSVQDMIFLMKVEEGPTFKYAAVNQAVLENTNVPKDCVGKYLHDVLSEEVLETILGNYEKVTKEKVSCSFQDKITLNNGKTIYGESILTPIVDDDDVCQYVISVTRDITVMVEEKIRMDENEQRYRSLFDYNMDAIISLDERGRFLNANPSTQDITGYTEKELLNRSIQSLIYDDDQGYFERIFHRTLSGDKETLTCRIIHKKGMVHYIQMVTVPIVINENITGIYIIARDITERRKNELTIERLAYYDDLTGVMNRTSLIKDLSQAVKKGKKFNQNFALMYLDLDRFKLLNDTMGHNVGDLLLKKVANRILNIVRNSSAVFRQGGDEFIIILRGANHKKSEEVAKKIVESFNKPFLLNRKEVYITSSIGISLFPKDGETENELIQNADTALYQVKQSGKNHYRFYSEEMVKGTPRTLLLETELRKAVLANEFILFYQPQVNIQTNEVESFEALIRWESPEFGFVSPGEFIPLAEETGLIIPIGRWVIHEVCRQLAEWKKEGFPLATIGLNLSTRQFQQADLVEMIEEAIHTHDIDPKYLDIEITEGAMYDAREAVHVLNQLKALGVKVSIDDFGTGYSSLAHLKHFPIDTLKIDKSFIHDLLSDKDSEAIVSTILHMARVLDMDVVAEGVETMEEVQFLKQKKCEKAQGFYYSRPVPAQKVEEIYFQTQS
ncbi:hypothetical protein BFG57_09230 [Bacillus solimangrovi]|uniref:Diguanylate cyclase n=1 Tax=Bacillus solimangrovi TaxID=1305675 RepID=A0A1E5LJP5_9BACI|nr:hypothetical protein BFG57_09230 [Bacillus solimangrovi]